MTKIKQLDATAKAGILTFLFISIIIQESAFGACFGGQENFVCCAVPSGANHWFEVSSGCAFTQLDAAVQCSQVNNETMFWKRTSCPGREPSPTEFVIRIFTIIDGKKCGLEWAGQKGGPVGDNERLAKFDCGGTADPLRISVSPLPGFPSPDNPKPEIRFFAKASGERCSLEWSSAMGGFTGINGNESLAKFDCDTQGDPMIRSGDRIHTIINGQKCFLEWSANFSGGQLGPNERAAKFDCASQGDAMIVEGEDIILE